MEVFKIRWRGGALCVEMGFYTDISCESRCNIEINVWAHFYKILLVFEVPYQPWVIGEAWKKLKLPPNRVKFSTSKFHDFSLQTVLNHFLQLFQKSAKNLKSKFFVWSYSHDYYFGRKNHWVLILTKKIGCW